MGWGLCRTPTLAPATPFVWPFLPPPGSRVSLLPKGMSSEPVPFFCQHFPPLLCFYGNHPMYVPGERLAMGFFFALYQSQLTVEENGSHSSNLLLRESMFFLEKRRCPPFPPHGTCLGIWYLVPNTSRPVGRQL